MKSGAAEPGRALSPEDWERGLAADLKRPVRVLYGRARRSVVRAADEDGVLVVRLNAMFADAPPEVRSSLSSWLRSGKRAPRASRILDDWIDQRLARLHEEEPRSIVHTTRGACYDLEQLAAEVIEQHFPGVFDAPGDLAPPRITWGRAAKSRSRHTLRLGSYDHAQRLVRIHTVLDQDAVPEWFVRYVVFHEHLHAALDSTPDEGPRVRPRRHHGPEFRKREAEYPDLARVLAWEREQIAALIVSARTQRPLRPRPRAARALRASSRWIQRALFFDGGA